MELHVVEPGLYVETKDELLSLELPGAKQVIGDLVMVDSERVLHRTFSKDQISQFTKELKESGWDVLSCEEFGYCDWPAGYNCEIANGSVSCMKICQE